MSGQVERRQALIDEVNEHEAPDGETALALIAKRFIGTSLRHCRRSLVRSPRANDWLERISLVLRHPGPGAVGHYDACD